MKVICIKLSSGEEIIGRFVESQFLTSASALFDPATTPWDVPKTDITVEKVSAIGIHPMGNGQMGVGLTPWSIGNQDATFTIKAEHITAVYPAIKDLEDSYVKQTTGIQIASSIKTPTTRM